MANMLVITFINLNKAQYFLNVKYADLSMFNMD